MTARPSSEAGSFIKTEEKRSMPEDPNKDSAATKNGKYWAYKDRSGNEIIINHQNGHENLTVKHRSGTKIQFNPDGAMVIEASKGSYTTIRGESQVYITGKQDVTIDGDASIKAKGDYNMTVGGKGNLTFEGDLQIKSKNFNLMSGCIDFGGKNMTVKNEGNMSILAQESLTISADKGLTIGSGSDSVAIGASKDVGIYAKSGNFITRSGKKTSLSAGNGMGIQTDAGSIGIEADNELQLKSGSQLGLKGGSEIRAAGSPEIHLNSGDPGKPLSPDDVTSDIKQAKPKHVECPKDETQQG